MPPQRKKKGASAVAEAYPTGPVMLGELIRALNMPLELPNAFLGDDRDDRNRTVYRTLAGEVVEEPALLTLCQTIGAALIDKQVIPAGGVGDAKPLVTVALYALVRQWDFATMEHRIGTARQLDRRVMTLAASQLLAIELAIRTGAWMALLESRAEISLDHTPQMTGVMERVLRSIARSQPQLAHELGVDETTLYRWRKGTTRPTDANLDQLAPHLSATSILSGIGDIRRRLAIAAILDAIRDSVQPFDIDDLWQMYVRTANRTLSFLNARPPEAIAKHLRRDLFLFGSGSDSALELVDHLRAQETEYRWQAVIDSLRNWNNRLEYARAIAWRFALPSTNAILAEPARTLLVNIALAEASDAIDQVASVASAQHPDLAPLFRCYAHLVHGAIARRKGDRPALIHHVNAAKELSTDIGVQEQVLTGLMEGGELDAAISHAATTKTTAAPTDARTIWAVKQIAEGRILDGRDELERLFAEGERSGELLLYLGTARWRCDDWISALASFEQLFELPEFEHHALALDIAAECAFRAGNQKRGVELARRANRLGIWRTYMRWQMSTLIGER